MTNGTVAPQQMSREEALLRASIDYVKGRRAEEPLEKIPAATPVSTSLEAGGEKNGSTVIEIDRPRLVQRYSPDQVELLKRTIAKKATDDELKLFVSLCERTGLDPFARQIYFMKRREFDQDAEDGRGGYVDRMSAEPSIDGLRLCAERTGKYAGQEDPLWCGPDGVWRDVWLDAKPPAAARVGILRSDFRQPMRAIALYSSYVQTKRDGTPNRMWLKMATSQLAKCAESLAFRKAFPRELSGLYTVEEMQQADSEQKEPSSPKKQAQEAARASQAEIAERKIDGMQQGKSYEQVSTEEKARIEPPAEPARLPAWCMSMPKIRAHFAEMEKRMPAQAFHDILHACKVDSPAQFKTPKEAFACHQIMEGWIEAAASPDSFENFEASEGEWQ